MVFMLCLVLTDGVTIKLTSVGMGHQTITPRNIPHGFLPVDEIALTVGAIFQGLAVEGCLSRGCLSGHTGIHGNMVSQSG